MPELPDRWIIDNKPVADLPVYTRANAGEVMPDPIAPLTGTLGLISAGDAGWMDAYAAYTFTEEELADVPRPASVGCFGGYLYLNMSLTRIYGVRTPGMTPEIVDMQYFGEMPGIPPYKPRPQDESPECTAQIGMWLQEVFTSEDLPELSAEKAEVDALVDARPDLSALSDLQLVERAREQLPIYRRLFYRHILTSAACGVGIGTVAGVLEAVGRLDLLTTLIAAAGDVDSAGPANAMWDLSRIIRSSQTLTAAFDEGVPGVLDRIEDTFFLAGFTDFMKRFGSRGPNEWELRSNTWETKPELALSAIERIRLVGDDGAPPALAERRHEERDAAYAEVVAILEAGGAETAEALGQFIGGSRAALLYSAGRERTKTTNIKIVHEQRLAIRELGRRFVERGALDTIEQIFMFTNDEMDEVVANPEAFTALAREREELYLQLFDLEPPFIIEGVVPPLPTWPRRGHGAPEAVAAGTTLTGIPGSPGKATGRARVVLDPSDPSALEPGDILVAPHTDPAWTPLFVPAAAVVVDVGAQITHAVIVSRELGIPCVVSVTGSTRKIADGAIVTVDGSVGTVLVH